MSRDEMFIMARKRKGKSPLDNLEEPDDLVEETNPEILFAENEGDEKSDAYISNCPKCGTTVTRGEYKCPKCGNLLI